MGRFKVTKQDTFIDMTPMSDVMVLLLTFFMLTATFVKEEPVKVNTPGSVSEIKIPENNLLTIFVEQNGKVFMSMDSPSNMKKLVDVMVENGAFQMSDAEKAQFAQVPMFGTPISTVPGWLKADDKNGILTSDPKPVFPATVSTMNWPFGYKQPAKLLEKVTPCASPSRLTKRHRIR